MIENNVENLSPELEKLYHDILVQFRHDFERDPLMVRSPGRINLIGEHTDYNQGFVLPAAIDKEIAICIALNGTETCNLVAWDLEQRHSFSLGEMAKSSLGWPNYIIGVVRQMQAGGYSISGFDCVFGGNIPIGAGLSSSAALECGVAFGLSDLFKLNLSKIEIARLGQNAECEFVGLQCGLMDQYANMFGEVDKLIQLDCRTETHQLIEVTLMGHGLWLFNSNVKHELGNSEYNVRRQECESGVEIIQQHHPQVKSLRDCDSSMLTLINDQTIRQRCEFIIEENIRVQEGCYDLMSGNLQAFGNKMYLSHQGLSEKYQVSCDELDTLVTLTKNEDYVLGSRMMGGGFGGCTINLIQEEQAKSMVDKISNQYRKIVSQDISVYPVRIANGTSRVTKPKIITF